MSRRFFYSICLSFVLVCAMSCEKNPGTEPQPEPDPKPEPVLLMLSTPDFTKTVLGPMKDGKFPVYWTEGDRVCVNGVKSSSLTRAGEADSRAEFVLDGVNPPYHIVFPSIICNDIDEKGIATIAIPEIQTWTENSFAGYASILFGSIEGTEGQLMNLDGVIRIPLVKGSEFGGNVNSITVSSNSENRPLAGEFKLSTSTGELTAQKASSSLAISLPSEGVALSEQEPRTFYVTVPGGDYPDGFNILLESPEGTMQYSWTESTSVPSGKVVTAPQIAFKPKNTKLIKDIDSWNEFATDVNNGDFSKWVDKETGEIALVSDISFGGDLVAIESTGSEFNFNGNGHKIDRGSAGEPLFCRIDEGATVKNLVIGGTRTKVSVVEDKGTGNLAAVNFGTVENCESKMDVTLDNVDENMIFAGLVTHNAGLLKDCRNSGNISISLNISADRIFYGGGISAETWAEDAGEVKCGQFVNCENSGHITVKRSASANASMCLLGIGGIAGIIETGTSTGEYTSFDKCRNSGNITIWQDDKHSSGNYGYGVGGIVGRCAIAAKKAGAYTLTIGGSATTAYAGYYASFTACENSGTIDVSIFSQAAKFSELSGAREVYVGGIAGVLQSNYNEYAIISGCKSKCSIKTGSAQGSDLSGGIVGGVGYADISNCEVVLSMSLSQNALSAPKAMGVGGGVAGYVFRDVTVKDCDVEMHYQKSDATSVGAGFVGSVLQQASVTVNVKNPGFATMDLLGTNYFSGDINGIPVKTENVCAKGSLGKINGTVTIK